MCPNCDTAVKRDAQFCGGCGAKQLPSGDAENSDLGARLSRLEKGLARLLPNMDTPADESGEKTAAALERRPVPSWLRPFGFGPRE